jgi:hypothetical protein
LSSNSITEITYKNDGEFSIMLPDKQYFNYKIPFYVHFSQCKIGYILETKSDERNENYS